MPIPTSKKFIEELAQRMCLEAGDSWIADDGAQDQWKSTALSYARHANQVERLLARAKSKVPRT